MPPTASPAAPPRAFSADSFAGMLQAVDGLRNGRAVLALVGCWVAAVLVGALLSMLAVVLGSVAALLSAIGFIVVAGTGINAAGALQMDQARGLAPRSLAEALGHGFGCVPKMIVLALVLLAVAVAVFIVIALALVLCKIPYLGALLYVVVFPVSVLIAGVTLTALFFGWLLALPAIWDGASIARAIAQTLAIVRSRFIEALLLLFVVGLLCLAVALIIFSVIGSGIVPTIALSLPIFGTGSMAAPVFMGDLMHGVGAGRAAAAGIGLMVLWAIAFAVIAQVYLQGLNRVYLRVTHGLDVESAEAALQQTMNAARERGADIADKARSAAAAREPTAAAPRDDTAAAPPPRSTPASTPMPDRDSGLIARAGFGAASRSASSVASEFSRPMNGSGPGVESAGAAAPARGPSGSAASASMAVRQPPDFGPTQPFEEAFQSTLPPADDDNAALPREPFATRLQPSAALGAVPVAGASALSIVTAVEPVSAADAFEPFSEAVEGRAGNAAPTSLGEAPQGEPDLPATVEPARASAATTIRCPHCLATCAADDAFCEACGQRLPRTT